MGEERDNDQSDPGNERHALSEPLLLEPETEGRTSSTEESVKGSEDDTENDLNEKSWGYKLIHSVVDIYSDQSGSIQNISTGLGLMFFVGTILGILLPKDADLPHSWYRLFSSIIGYIYFVCWSLSFYPQIITNHERKSIEGLSTDAAVMAVVNYICYTCYNAFFFWDEGIRREYKERYGPDATITVQSNDVAFSIHALLLCLIMLGQVVYYGGFQKYPLSRVTIVTVVIISLGSLIYCCCILLHVPGNFNWIDFLYILATIKLVLTIMTYIPQVLLNYQRQSTVGWNVWNVLFDFSGGVLSMVQLITDSVDLNNMKEGLLGNWAKLLLGVITLVFDMIYLLQHFVLYRDGPHDSQNDSYSLLEEQSSDEVEIETQIV